MNIEQTHVNLDQVIEIRLLNQRKVDAGNEYGIHWLEERNPNWFLRNFFGETFREAGFYSYGTSVSLDEISKKHFIVGKKLVLKPRVVFDYSKENCTVIFFETFEEAEKLYQDAVYTKKNYLKVK